MAGQCLIGFCFTGKHKTTCDLHLDGTEQSLLSQPRVGERSPGIIEIFLFSPWKKGERGKWKGRKEKKQGEEFSGIHHAFKMKTRAKL